MKYLSSWLIVLIILGLVATPIQAQQPGGDGQCRDATGAVIPCPDTDSDGVPDHQDSCPREVGTTSNLGCPETAPADRDGDGLVDTQDQCPDQPGTTVNMGCPEAAPSPENPQPLPSDRDGDGLVDTQDQCPDQPGTTVNMGCPTPEATLVPVTTPAPPNALRPDPAGACQLATLTTERVNVRVNASTSAEIVSQLAPNMLYDVLAVVIVNGEIWYRVEAGWVASFVVAVAGDCPVTGIEVEPAVYMASLSLEEECFNVVTGERICLVDMFASAEDGATVGKGKCPGWKGKLLCLAIEIAADIICELLCPDGDDGGGSGGDDDGGTTGGEDDGGTTEGNVSCEEPLLDLVATSGDESPFLIVYSESGASGVLPLSANLPSFPPEPCTLKLEVRRGNTPEQAPVDRILLEFNEFPPVGVMDPTAPNAVLPIFTMSEAGHVFFERILVREDGLVCVDFTAEGRGCPVVIPSASFPSGAELEMISAIPEDLDEYQCQKGTDSQGGFWACACWGDDDCLDLISNACAGESMTCFPDGHCGCTFDAEE